MASAPQFRKSSFSDQQGCVEVMLTPAGGAAVRDSKNPSGPVLTYNQVEWQAFLAGAKAGEFDLPV